ncbi:MAG: diguanylate cyclase [Halomonadaceae bacterium]|nr:MAG: diguanylate cyclase [Halomonadaceae bacterium]
MDQENQREKLRQHFARRVTTQARQILELWQQCREQGAAPMGLREELINANYKLSRYAQRFAMERHQAAAASLKAALETWPDNLPMDTAIRDALQSAMDLLSECTLRRSDQQEDAPPRTYLRTPVFMAINDQDQTQRIIRQMEFFGFRAAGFSAAEALEEEAIRHKPDTLVIDTDFGGSPDGGLAVVERIQGRHETPIPVIFVSDRDGSIETRLRAVRCGGEEFFHPAVDPGQLIEKVESYTHSNPVEPYRVMVVDDSRAQAKYMENALIKAGMHTCIITDPMSVMQALSDFSPEIIILDMYMPGCTGMEIAKVIRQQDHLHSVPIIYLSAEDDVAKQLHAMSMGGDDFLTKPIDARHLIATLHNRGRRARSMQALMVRDSLTGLYNHSHILHLLTTEISRARQTDHPLSFAMLDLDHFKTVNDTYGHAMGDRVLRSLSMFLKQRLRRSDHIGRYGGEEFVVIMPETGLADARNVLNEIREKFSELQHPAGEREFSVTFSAGLAQWQGNASQGLCETADQALYLAKAEGRNRVHISHNPSAS